MSVNCHSVRDAIKKHLIDAVVTEQLGDACIVTIPVPTVDGRIVGVFVERRVEDFFIVHDGGKAVNELILQGYKITESDTNYLNALAENFNISFRDESFQTAGKQAEVARMVLSVASCSGLAMAPLVGYSFPSRVEPVREQFGRALRMWAKKRFQVRQEVSVTGRRGIRHSFDFVASPKSGTRQPIAMSIIYPGSNPKGAAERFGFLVTDLDATSYEKWPRVAVQDRSDLWTAEAKNIVRACSDVVIEIPTGSKVDAQLVSEYLQPLVA